MDFSIYLHLHYHLGGLFSIFPSRYTLHPCILPCSIPQQPDLYKPHQKALLPLGFWLDSVHGEYQQEVAWKRLRLGCRFGGLLPSRIATGLLRPSMGRPVSCQEAALSPCSSGPSLHSPRRYSKGSRTALLWPPDTPPLPLSCMKFPEYPV